MRIITDRNTHTKEIVLGFTLIELLVVMAVLAVVGSIILGLLFSTIRSSTKASTITNIRQNGNSVITQIQRIVRYGYLDPAPGFASQCDGVSRSNFSVLSTDKLTTYTYACSSGPNTITLDKNGSGATSLINTTDSEIINCQFVCTRANSSVPPVLTVQFTIQAKNASIAESIATVPFKTSVSMRNE